MKVVVLAGYSGAGKTTLAERLIPVLRAAGLRVSVVKHAHHDFDIDHPGKDSFRHRGAGAFEVVIASRRRLALLRENEVESDPNLHHLIAQLYEGVDWVFVEGFRHADLPKIEVWREGQEASRPPLYPEDPFVTAIVTDTPGRLPVPTLRPVLDLNDGAAVAAWLVDNGARFDYNPDIHS